MSHVRGEMVVNILLSIGAFDRHNPIDFHFAPGQKSGGMWVLRKCATIHLQLHSAVVVIFTVAARIPARRSRLTDYTEAALIQTFRYVQVHLGCALIQRYAKHYTCGPSHITQRPLSMLHCYDPLCVSVDKLIARDDESCAWLQWCSNAIKAYFRERPPFIKLLWRLCECKRFQLRRWEWDGLQRAPPNLSDAVIYSCGDDALLRPLRIETLSLLRY
eukprot:3937855-Prymnesium_polylepis.1